jgi:mRNA interferase HigB
MRIISKSRLIEFWSALGHADAQMPLQRWYAITRSAAWKGPADVKATFGANVDFVKVRSGSTVAVIAVGANKYRLIAAIHYQKVFFAKGRVYVLQIMDHREYDHRKWIEEL